jgi:methylase of polypeptide subunit release factors
VPPDNNQNQTPYAIVKLEEAARTVKQAVNEFTALRKKLDKIKNNKQKAQEVYADLQQQFTRLKNALDTSTLALLEMELPDMADYSAKLTRTVKGFNLMTPDYGKLCAALNDYLAKLPLSDIKTTKTTNAAIIGRLMASVKMGYYPTDMEHLKYITRGIEFPEGITTNLLDPCCGCGLALQTLAREHGCNTYGVELDKHRAEEAITRLNRVGFGSYFHSRVSQEAFHLMLLNPPYLSVMTEGGSNARSEKRFLVDCYSHLMYGGLMIYVIPYYRLTSDVCRVLCDNFEDLTVWKFMEAEFKKFRQVAVMGLRCKRRDGSKLVQELASFALKPDTLRELSELPEGRYRLPETAVKVNTFKGAQFNVHEMAEQLKRSASFSKLFEKNKLDSTCKRPLLPLNIGQVGLIGGSGLINGLVECGTPHIIKGRVVKEIVVSKERNLNSKGDLVSTSVTETRSNKMIFNLLTPQGFISLSDYESQDMDDGMSATA